MDKKFTRYRYWWFELCRLR